jgi:hypothetical protein
MLADSLARLLEKKVRSEYRCDYCAFFSLQHGPYSTSASRETIAWKENLCYNGPMLYGALLL